MQECELACMVESNFPSSAFFSSESEIRDPGAARRILMLAAAAGLRLVDCMQMNMSRIYPDRLNMISNATDVMCSTPVDRLRSLGVPSQSVCAV
mmetsp:Transcript_2501/g.5811  ORF Transcript_2501/g.5811 Transcript_2501/m.5811 type:complete len:94 (+) Transcript_2501:1062-1343(+)